MKALKIIFGFLAVVMVLLLVLPFFIPQRVYLGFVVQELESRYPIELELADASFALLPQPNVTLENVHVKIKTEPEVTPFLFSKKFRVTGDWRGLMKKTVFLTLDIDNAQLNLREISPNNYNVKALIKSSEPRKSSPSGWDIIPQRVRVENSQVSISRLTKSPETSSQTYAVDFFEISHWAEESKHHSAYVEITAHPPQITDALNLRVRPVYDSIAQIVSFQDLSATWGDAKAHVEGSIDLSKKEPRFALKGELFDFALERLKTIPTLSKNSFLARTQGLWDLKFATQGTLSALSGEAEIKTDDFSFTKPGQVNIADENFTSQFRFAKSGSQIKLTRGEAKLGPQKAQFTAVIVNKSVQLTAVLNPLQIDYLKAHFVQAQKLPQVQDASLSLNYRNSALSGHFAAGKIKLDGNDVTKASADFHYQNKILRVSSLRAGLMGGNLSGTVVVDQNPAAPIYDFDVDLDGINLQQIPRLDKAVEGRGNLSLNAKTSGVAEAWKSTMNGNGTIATENIRIPKLDVFSKLAENKAWTLLQAIPGGIDTGKVNELKSIDAKIKDLQSQFKVRNGLVEIPRVNLNFPNAQLSVTGELGLDRTLNLRGDLRLDEKLIRDIVASDQLEKVLLARGNTLKVPLVITGRFSAPHVALDDRFLANHFRAAALLYAKEAAQSETVKTAVETIRQKIEESLPPTSSGEERQLPTASEIFEAIEERIQGQD